MKRSLVLALAVLFALLMSTVALAAPLTGEVFTWNKVASYDGNFFCTQAPGSTTSTGFNYSLYNGTAAGPYSGTFSEDGFVTFSSSGAVTSWTAHFVIYDASHNPIVRGNKTLVTGGAGSCTHLSTSDSGSGSATLHYVAYDWASGAQVDQGTATVSATLTIIWFTEQVSGSFTETFGAQPGCNSSGNSNGNDSCNQNGSN